jgi:lipopolysaccharide/colanic/teichoic acid biosynthesis glycosyltransferase
MPVQELLDLHYEGLAIEDASSTYESLNQRVCARELNTADLIFSCDLAPAANVLAAQRLLDRAATLGMLVVCLPLMAIVAGGLFVLSRKPLMYRSRRAGYHGKAFELIRFRRPASEHSIYARLHLDALPALFNVLRGEMSLVGPKAEEPEVAEARSREFALYDYRLNVPPGITGWAQINLSPREREEHPLKALEYDLYYIKHMSQALNAYILMTTLKNRLVWGDVRP